MSKQNLSNLLEALTNWIVHSDCEALGPLLELHALEDRVLYSAGPIPLAASQPMEIVEPGIDSPDFFNSIDAQLDMVAGVIDNSGPAGLEDESSHEFTVGADLSSPDLAGEATNEIVIVDRSVEGFQALVDDIVGQSNSARNFEIYYLDSDQNGISQITEILALHSNVEALHLVTHGSDGLLAIGNTELSLNNLGDHAAEIMAWGGYLTGDADLLIYGCDVAETEEGQSFVEAIADLSGLDVAASDDLTASNQFGGDWDFEFEVGTVEANVAFSVFAQQNWEGTLSTQTVTADPTDSINDDTSGDGRGSQQAVALDAAGNYVIVWTSDAADQDGFGVNAQRYDSTGTAVGPVINVNDNITGDQQYASVASDANGNFTVTWTDSDQSEVNIKRYAADGTQLSGEIRVNNPDLTGTATDSTIAMNSAGNFVVAWVGEGLDGSRDIYASVFAADGTLILDNFLVNSSTEGDQLSPNVSINESGNFVVSWHDGNGVYAQRFNANGSLPDGEITVSANTNILGLGVSYDFSSVALQDDNSFAVSYENTALGNAGPAVSLYNNSGNFVTFGADNQSGANFQGNASIQVGADGTYIFVWEGFGNQPGEQDPDGVFARLLDSSGNAITDEFRVNDFTSGSQNNISVAINNQNSYVFVYSGESATDSQGVFTTVVGAAPIANTAPTAADNTLRFLEDGVSTILTSDLGFADSDGDTLISIEVTSVPTNGTLLYEGAVVSAGDILDPADVDSGALRFLPAADSSGDNADSFRFRVNDGTEFSSTDHAISFDIDAVVDEPGFGFGQSLESIDGASLVNETTIGEQTNHQIAELEDGGYVVVWQDTDGDFTDGDQGTRILLQRYDADGNRVFGEHIVDPNEAGAQLEPDVVGLADGGYLVVWTQEDVGGGSEIFAERYNSAGVRVLFDGVSLGSPSEFRVNQNTSNQQFGAVATALSDGGFVIAWTTLDGAIDADGGVVGRVYDAAGNAADEFRINDTIGGVQQDVQLLALDGGRFVAGWLDESGGGSDAKIKFFDPGNPFSGSEITLNDTGAQSPSDIQLTQLDSGTILVSWEAASSLDGDGTGIFGIRFDVSGNPIDSSATLINQVTAGDQSGHSIVGLGQGEFIAFWSSDDGDVDGTGVKALRFDSTLSAVGSEFSVNSHGFGDQTNPEAIVLASGEIVAVWNSSDGDNGNGSFGNGIFHDRFIPVASGTEDLPIPLDLNIETADGDGSESITSILISGIPDGVTLTDGVNTFVGTPTLSSVDIANWNQDSLTITGAANSHGSFDLTAAIEVTDGVEADAWTRMIRVNIDAVGDRPQLDGLIATVDEDSTVDISAAVIAASVTDLDDGVIPSLTVSPAVPYTLDPAVPPAISGSNFIWPDTSGSNLDFLLDTSAVSFNSAPGSQFPGINAAFDFNGTGGGQLELAIEAQRGNASLEFWIRPDNLTQTSTIFEFGDSELGLALYQNGNQLEFHFLESTTIDGNGREPVVLAAEGFSTTEYNQVVIVIDESGASGGDTSDPDLHLYLNGELVSTLADISFDWDGVGRWRIGEPNGFAHAGSTTFGNYVGSLAEFNFYDAVLSSDDVSASFHETTHQQPQLELIDGQPAIAGSTYTLSSGATLTYNLDGSFTYDPNDRFESLNVGLQGIDNVDLTFTNAAGSTTSQLVIQVEGVNDEVTLANASTTIDEIASHNDLVIDLNASDPDDTSFTYQIVSGNTGNVFSIDSASGEIRVNGQLDFETAPNYELEVSATDSQGDVASADITIGVNDIVGTSVTGTIYEDVIGDGSVSGDSGVAGVTVVLYRDNGDGEPDAADAIVSSTSTNGAGGYEFTDVGDGNYYVVVDSRTITPVAGFNSGFGIGDVWAEQTYGASGAVYWDAVTGDFATLSSSGAFFGGANGARSDDASSLTTAEHLNFISVSGTSIDDVDFGFSFNVVTHVEGGGAQDDDVIQNRTVQGSIRQFIQNANAIVDNNALRFVPIVDPNQTSAGGSWWSIGISEALPEILDAGTTIDGLAYNPDGSIRNENQNIIGYSGDVGVGADGVGATGDEFNLSGLDTPELEIYDAAGLGEGLVIKASNVEITNLAIRGFGNTGTDGGNILVDGSSSDVVGVTIQNNVLGSSAGTFAAPDSVDSQSRNITIRQADDGLIEGNLIGFSDSSSVQVRGSDDLLDGADNWRIIGNVIQDGGRGNSDRDGINIGVGSSNTFVSRNLIAGNAGFGIDIGGTGGEHTISENTIIGNGDGISQSGGVRLVGSDNVVEHNLIQNNTGAGVLVTGQNGNGSQVIAASTGNLISQNSFSGNSGLAIDLTSSGAGNLGLVQGDGVSDNEDASDVDAGNAGLDHPELSDAFIDNLGLHLFGTIENALNIAEIEIYVAEPGAGDSDGDQTFGEGSIFLATVTQSEFVNYNPVTGEFEILVATPAAGWPDVLTNGGSVTATSIQSTTNNTSEFSNTTEVEVVVDVPPVAVPDLLQVNFEEPLVFDQSVLLDNDIVPDNLPSEPNVEIVVRPTNGTLTIVDGILTYTPDEGFVGRDFFEYTIGGNSNLARVGINVAPDSLGPTTVDETRDEETRDEETESEQETDSNDPVGDTGVASEIESEDDTPEVGPVAGPFNDFSVDTNFEGDQRQESQSVIDELESNQLDSIYVYSGRSDLQLGELVGVFASSQSNVELSKFESSLLAALVWDEAESEKRGFVDSQLQIGVPGIAASAASFLTVGYLAWIVRGGVLLTTFMSSIPTWSSFDIGSIIASAEDSESIEQMVDQ